jgi:UDP-glucose 4-epimerase
MVKVASISQNESGYSRGDSIAVVGATCPLGKSLVELLLAAGFSVHGFYRSSHKVPPPWKMHPAFRGTEFDLSHASVLAETLETSDRIVWLAQSRDDSTDVDGEDLNALAVKAVCARPVHDHRRIVLLSSGGSIYGNPRSLPVSEDHPCRPLSKYGESKKKMEEALRASVERMVGLSGTVLRCGNIYGANYLAANAMGCIGAFTRAVIAHQPITLVAGGLAVRDFVHVDDVLQAILFAIIRGHRFAVWNVGSGVGTPIVRVLEMICEILGYPPAQLVNVDAPATDVKGIVLNIARIERDCSWRPQVSLLRGLESILIPLRRFQETNPRHSACSAKEQLPNERSKRRAASNGLVPRNL